MAEKQTPKSTPRRTPDAEIQAMARMDRELSSLTPAARLRALGWLNQRHGQEATKLAVECDADE